MYQCCSCIFLVSFFTNWIHCLFHSKSCTSVVALNSNSLYTLPDSDSDSWPQDSSSVGLGLLTRKVTRTSDSDSDSCLMQKWELWTGQPHPVWLDLIHNKNAFQYDAYHPLHWPSADYIRWVWAWRLARARPLNLPLGVGLETFPCQTPHPHSWVWAWVWAWIPVDRMTDTGKNITFANFVCRR